MFCFPGVSVVHFFLLLDNSMYVCMYVCTYVFMAALGLHCCSRAFSSCGERELLFVVVCSGFSCCGARAVGAQTSVVVAHGLSSCGSWALEHRLSSCGAWV